MLEISYCFNEVAEISKCILFYTLSNFNSIQRPSVKLLSSLFDNTHVIQGSVPHVTASVGKHEMFLVRTWCDLVVSAWQTEETTIDFSTCTEKQ